MKIIGHTSYLICTFFLMTTISIHGNTQGIIKLGTVINLPPFSFYESGTLKGIDIEVITEISNRTHIPIEIQPSPWIRVISFLQSGDIDGAFSVYENEERKQFCTYLGIVHYDNLGIVTKKGKEFTFNGIEDLFGKAIVKGAGVYVNKEFEAATKNNKITVYEINDTQMGNIKMLQADRADAAIGVIETMLFYAKNIDNCCEMVSLDKQIDKKRPGYLVISNKSYLYEDKFTQGKMVKVIEEIMNDGTYDRIVHKYEDYIRK